MRGTTAPKWTQFKRGNLFVCPVDGSHSYSTPQGLSGHMKSHHRAAFDRVMRGEALDRQIQPGENPVEHLQAGGTIHATPENGRHAKPELHVANAQGELAPAKRPNRASAAAVAILGLDEVSSLSVGDLRKVMESVCAVMELDEPKTSVEAGELLEGTGFATEGLRRHLPRQQAAHEAVA